MFRLVLWAALGAILFFGGGTATGQHDPGGVVVLSDPAAPGVRHHALQTGGPMIAFSPAVVHGGDTYIVTGTGFHPDTLMSIAALFETAWVTNNPTTDSAGTFTTSFVARDPGLVEHRAYEWRAQGQGPPRFQLRETAYLTVVP